MWNKISKKLPTNYTYKYQHQIADEFVKEFAAVFHTSINKVKAAINMRELELAIQTGNVDAFMLKLNWDLLLKDSLYTQWTPIIYETANKSGQQAWKNLSLRGSFNMKNPYAEKWVREHAAELVVQVVEETKAGIRKIIVDGFVHSNPPVQMARKIRDWIGLTNREEAAVLNYWEKLLEEGDAKRADDMADTYYKRMLNKRAMRIARTETLTASNQGTVASWQQAQQEGYLLPETRRVWIAATQSDRTCKFCMSFDGQEATVDGMFKAKNPDYGESSGPVLHVNCRCAQGLRTVLPEVK
jgi:hypothetical protein